MPESIYLDISERHGRKLLKHIRSLEGNYKNLMKVEADISFIKSRKIENFMPAYAKGKLSIVNVNRKLQYKMTKLVMEAEQ